MELLRISVVMENETGNSELDAEHGLSLYIEANNYKILFDAGQSGKMISNAKKMGVPLSEIDYLVLSHGHYDHTGGVIDFLKENSKAKIVYKNGLFTKRYNRDKYIGVQFDKKQLEGRSMVVNKTTELVPDLFVVTKIDIENEKDTHFNNLLVKKVIGKGQDTFKDELFLVIKKDKKINVITGCAHRGITNITRTAMKRFAGLPVNSIIGGFHLSKETDEVKKIVCDEIEKINPEVVYPMHCTGRGSLDKITKVKVSAKQAGDIFII